MDKVPYTMPLKIYDYNQNFGIVDKTGKFILKIEMTSASIEYEIWMKKVIELTLGLLNGECRVQRDGTIFSDASYSAKTLLELVENVPVKPKRGRPKKVLQEQEV